MSVAPFEPTPGTINNSAIAHRARLVAAAVMAATRGVPPGPALHTYVTDDVFRRIEFRAKGHRVRRPDPGYECRTHLTLVNRQVIEASVIVTGHNLTRAIAIRLERRPRGWQAVEFVTA